jgi:prepilin-type processing-associated H-X9-DG protein
VVIGVTSLLLSLALPAIQQSREEARRAACQSRLKQLGVALANHVSQNGHFPAAARRRPECDVEFDSVFIELLPFLGAESAYASINSRLCWPQSRDADHTARRIWLEVFLCPSDSIPRIGPWGGVNFRASHGPTQFVVFNTSVGPVPNDVAGGKGAFQLGAILRPANFIDGLASTAMVSEKPRGLESESFDPFRHYWLTTIHVHSIDEMLRACDSAPSPPQYYWTLLGHSWYHVGGRYTSYTHDAGPNSRIPDCLGPMGADPGWGYNGAFAARSYHPGGVNVLFGDGRAERLGSGIDVALWRALGTRNGGEALQP